MAEVGVVPSPDSPYLELDAPGPARRFSKHVLTVGETFIHPASGRPLTVDESWWSDLKRNWDARLVPIVQFPAADERNRHTEDPRANLGRVVDLRRDGQKIYADVEVPDPAVADKVGKTILGASAMLHMDYPDPRNGRRRGKALVHVAATNHPHLISLDPYEELAASSTELHEVLPDGSVLAPRLLMLCADQTGYVPLELADPEPDYPPELDYYGGNVDEDHLRGEFGRLSLAAYQVSSGRATKPDYPLIITDRDRQMALSAGTEVTDTDVLEATGELSRRLGVPYSDVSAAVVECSTGNSPEELALGLAAVVQAAGPGSGLELSSAEDEIDRLLALTARPTGIHHPSRSGVLVDSASRAHSEDDDPSDSDQPGKGGEVHAKIRRIIEENPDLFSDGKGRDPSAKDAWPSPGPKSPAQREAEEKRALAGGRPGKRGIEDYARGSARTRSGR